MVEERLRLHIVKAALRVKSCLCFAPQLRTSSGCLGNPKKVPQTDLCTAAINVRSISSETPWLTAPRGTPAVKRLVSSLWLLISARGQPSVRRNGPLEVFIFLAGNEAEVFQRRQLLLCFGRLPKHQISLTEMLMRAAVAGI